MSSPKRILVIRLRYLGDVILLEPVLRLLRREHPEAELHVLVPAMALEVVRSMPHGVIAHGWDGEKPWKSLRFLTSCRLDTVVDLTGSDRSALVSLLSGASRRIAYEAERRVPRWSIRRWAYNVQIPLPRPKPHVLAQHLELLEKAGLLKLRVLREELPRPKLAVDPEHAMRAEEFLKKNFSHCRRIVFAHLTSRDMQKAIPKEIAAKVIGELSRVNVGTLLSTGASDHERQHIEGVIRALPDNAHDTVRLLKVGSFAELCGYISVCQLYWGADTAPMHASAALGLPVVCHFGPSNASHWRPLSEKAVVDVHECPCLKKPVTCQYGAPGLCLREIDPQATVSMILESLESHGS